MRPGRPLVLLLAAWSALGVAAAALPGLLSLWMAAGVLLAAAAWMDWRVVRRLPVPTVVRRVPGSLPVGVEGQVSLRVASAGEPQVLAVYDHHPPGHEVRGLPQRLALPRQGWAEISYRLRPLYRGEQHFGPVELSLEAPFRLWQRRAMAGEAQAVRVFPNFAAVSRYALLATSDRLAQMGIRLRQRRGEGLEFHQLREYRPGDSLRQIDWKATSRHRRLISREYQDERDQQLMFLLDCGRRMGSRDGELSHFDHCLDAMLLLAHVALKQGDAVGLSTFAGVNRHIPPRKGAGALPHLLGASYDLQPTLAAPDYSRAALDFMARVRKRSLVVIVTNLRDEDEAELVPALKLLRRRHLVILASLREAVLSRALEAPVADFDAAVQVAATQQYLLSRRRVHERLTTHGVISVDVEPAKLPVAVVNRYLEVKRGGSL